MLSMLNVNTSNKWTRALWEPAAGVAATKSCVALSDLQGQHDFQLVLVDESATPSRLKLFKGLRTVIESVLADVPSGIASFVCDLGKAESTCLAVACGASLLIYRNMKPYYRYKVPQKDILPSESELWNRLKQGKIQKGQLIDGLKQLHMEHSIGVMSYQSQQLLTLDPDASTTGGGGESMQNAFIEFVLKKETRGEGDGDVQLQNVQITCLATIPRNQSQTSADVLILGTERGSVYFVDSQAYTLLQHNTIAAVPVKMLPVGHFDLAYRLIVCTREHDVFVLRRSGRGEFSVNSFFIREYPFDVVLCASLLVFATRKRCIVFYSLKGRRQNSIKFEHNINDIEQFYYEPKQYNGVLVALVNEIHLYVNQLRVDTIRMDHPIEWIRFGRMGREEGVLVIATVGGGLCVKIFRRVANFEESRLTTTAQRKPTKNTIELPKKSRTFVDQSLRERQNVQLLHQIYQRDWFMLKWHATKTFAELKTGRQGGGGLSLPTADSDEPIQIQYDLLGFGPLFRLKIRLVASKKLDGQNRWMAFVFNADEYIFTDRMIPIPRPLMPNRPVTLCTDIRCLHPEKQLVEEEVQMLLCREERARPVWTANFQMPLSELEII
uniref:Bardet-Biedl syndrome 1 N-terminal domain-containing protein n=1 Tax=Globodera rostochiensis TaxID=31243 RepID=A0A914HRP6_GLORO